MQYVTIPADRFADVIEHLRRTFFVDEPLYGNGCGQVGGSHDELEKYVLSTLAEGVSVMAVTAENEIAGVRINGIVRPGQFEQALAKIANNPDERFVRVLKMLCEANHELNLFERYQTEAIFELRFLSVDGRFRRQGIARGLMHLTYKVAAAAGLRHLKSESTGLYSQGLMLSEGFETVAEINYAERKNPDGSAMFSVPAPHVSLKILIKTLDVAAEEKAAE